MYQVTDGFLVTAEEVKYDHSEESAYIDGVSALFLYPGDKVHVAHTTIRYRATFRSSQGARVYLERVENE